jgi:STAS-like domain of unknown function (DUF4325)
MLTKERTMTEIKVAEDFSLFPAGRFYSDGKASGQRFREEVVLPALRAEQHGAIAVYLDGTFGYGSSFLEEAFGGLVREHGFTYLDLLNKLDLKSADPSLILGIRKHIFAAEMVAKPKRR